MRRRNWQKWMIGVGVLIAGLTAPGLAFAQGCALCYNTAAAASAGAIQALRSGILILMIPPVLIFGATCIFALRNRNRFNDGDAVDVNPRSLGRDLPWVPVAAGATSREVMAGAASRLGKSSQDEISL